TDRIDEVGPPHALQRGAYLPEVEQVAEDNIGLALLKPLRPVVLPMGQRPHGWPRASSSSTVARPVSPVAPVIRTFPGITASLPLEESSNMEVSCLVW